MRTAHGSGQSAERCAVADEASGGRWAAAARGSALQSLRPEVAES